MTNKHVKIVLARARESFPLGHLIIAPDYYGYSGVFCPRTHKKEICHEGFGNIGYICKYYGGFYPGDLGIFNCLYGVPIQLELFNF